jgi:hypothetical protein
MQPHPSDTESTAIALRRRFDTGQLTAQQYADLVSTYAEALRGASPKLSATATPAPTTRGARLRPLASRRSDP